jgi:hypothetical protein
MGNCIDDYRAAIVLFHIRITGNRRPFKLNFPVYTCQEILLTNFRCPELINHSSVSDNSISICNINIRSARNKLDFLNNVTDEFDIIAVIETHLHPNISNNDIEIDSFSKI